VATVTKADLLDRVAGSAGVSKSQAEGVLEAFFETVRSSAKKGDKVGWPGFGNFSTTKRAARTGRNPRTGASVKIPASTAMKFSASSTLKDFFKGGSAAKKSTAKKGGAKKTAARKR
jgi:DNA-binding protein HU-beta